MRKRTKSLGVVLGILLLLPLALEAHKGHEGHEAMDGEPMSILTVAPGSAAETAGVQVGDRLAKLAGRDIITLGDLEQVMGQREPGDRVPLVVIRDGRPVELELVFGERDGGRTALGVSFQVMQAQAIGSAETAAAGDRLGKEQCLTWLDETYRAASTAERFGLDRTDRIAELRTCVAGDLDLMNLPIPFGWCDNVYKIHCSGLDLLTELGEEQIAFCEESLAESAGIDPGRERAWTTCGADRIFERYSRNGQTSDAAACREVFEACKSEQ